MFDFSQASTPAPDSTAPSSTPDADNDAKNETSLSRTSSYGSIPELLPVVEGNKAAEDVNNEQQTTTPISEHKAPLSEEPVLTRERSDSNGSNFSSSM